jgi:hypothetical protein
MEHRAGLLYDLWDTDFSNTISVRDPNLNPSPNPKSPTDLRVLCNPDPDPASAPTSTPTPTPTPTLQNQEFRIGLAKTCNVRLSNRRFHNLIRWIDCTHDGCVNLDEFIELVSFMELPGNEGKIAAPKQRGGGGGQALGGGGGGGGGGGTEEPGEIGSPLVGSSQPFKQGQIKDMRKMVI